MGVKQGQNQDFPTKTELGSLNDRVALVKKSVQAHGGYKDNRYEECKFDLILYFKIKV